MPCKPKPPEDRFWPKVRKTEGCWVWVGGKTPRGYGCFQTGGKGTPQIGAHRASYIFANGPIPEGMCVLHRCDNPPCVNPAHLFLGTMKDNTRDMVAKGRSRNQATFQTHCKRGHEFTPENTYVRSPNHRICRTCALESARRTYHRNGYGRISQRERYHRRKQAKLNGTLP